MGHREFVRMVYDDRHQITRCRRISQPHTTHFRAVGIYTQELIDIRVPSQAPAEATVAASLPG
jgi:hypothetical protein